MFICQRRFRNPLPIWLCALTLLSGCGAQLFLRFDHQEVDERLFYVLGGGGNSAVLVHDHSALLIDPKFSSLARRLKTDVEAHGRQVQRLVVTHSHGDHAGGVGLYPGAGAVIVHPNTRRRLEAQGERAAWVEVEKEIRLVLGGEVLRVIHPGGGHTDGDLVVLLEKHRVLIAGDLFLSGYEPVIDVEAGGNVLELRTTLDALLELDFVTVLPGHGDPAPRKELEQLRDYLAAVETAVRAARASGASEDAAVDSVKVEPPGLHPVPFGASRENTVRLVYRALDSAGAGR